MKNNYCYLLFLESYGGGGVNRKVVECIFCQITTGKVPAKIVYEDELVMVFEDVNPQAPIHLLLIPRKHLPNLMSLSEVDEKLSSHFFTVIKKMVQQYGIEDKGFRVVVNTGEDGGQTVQHLHFHLLGARAMKWPPG
jgi:histidine triad (HIT) family protein